jgi:hypothetical protein
MLPRHSGMPLAGIQSVERISGFRPEPCRNDGMGKRAVEGWLHFLVFHDRRPGNKSLNGSGQVLFTDLAL